MSAHPDRAPAEIEPGVTVADLATLEDCDRALDGLTMAIAQIERQLSATPRNSPNQPAGWRANAELALRIKKLLLPRVQERRADLKRRARQDRHRDGPTGAVSDRAARKRRVLIDIAWECEPEAMRRVEAQARKEQPELFCSEEA